MYVYCDSRYNDDNTIHRYRASQKRRESRSLVPPEVSNAYASGPGKPNPEARDAGKPSLSSIGGGDGVSFDDITNDSSIKFVLPLTPFYSPPPSLTRAKDTMRAIENLVKEVYPGGIAAAQRKEKRSEESFEMWRDEMRLLGDGLKGAAAVVEKVRILVFFFFLKIF
jgi:hypothetical protein